MKDSITLYHLESESIKIDIVARFEEDELIIDGYDMASQWKKHGETAITSTL